MLVCAMSLSACDIDPATEAQARHAERLSPAAIERLEALGYEPFVEEAHPPRRTGVLLHTATKCETGFVLFANRGDCSAWLIDREGHVVQRWATEPKGYWSDTALLDDGTLLVVGATSADRENQQEARYLRRLDADSNVLWQAPFPAHHDIEIAPRGRLLTLSSRVRDVDDNGTTRTIIDDEIVFLDRNGKPEKTISIFDAFAAAPGIDIYGLDRRGVEIDGVRALDVFHTNSVEWIDVPRAEKRAPLYAEGNILISMRHQSALAVIDPRARKVVWAWGRDVLDGQHSARMLDSGNILVFDNGLRRKRSRVLEIDPVREAVVREIDGGDEAFFSTGGGASQRLPNGNTLITVTAKGTIFEVTPTGETVWRFVNPTRDPQERRRATIHASTWLADDAVAPLLAAWRTEARD